jgi:hypothetical protein
VVPAAKKKEGRYINPNKLACVCACVVCLAVDVSLQLCTTDRRR